MTGAQDLDFGAIIPGFGSTVLTSDAASGEFVISGANGAGVDLDFVVPANLQNATFDNLPVTFTAAVGADRATAVAIADVSAGDASTIDGTSGEVRVFLGGTATAGANQPAGTYSGTVTLTATYNGL